MYVCYLVVENAANGFACFREHYSCAISAMI